LWFGFLYFDFLYGFFCPKNGKFDLLLGVPEDLNNLTLGEGGAVMTRGKACLQLVKTESLNSLALDFSQVL
jgi:hypothetical protein